MPVEAIGFIGGIWMLWCNSIHVTIVKTHPQFVSLQVREKKETWFFFIVYMSPIHGLHKQLRKNLCRDRLNLNKHWLAAGNFNVVTSEMEVSPNSNFSNQRCANFVDWIFNEGLIDLGFDG